MSASSRPGTELIPCNCNRLHDHAPGCSVAQAFRFRCPDCRSLNRSGKVTHAYHCKLKGLQP